MRTDRRQVAAEPEQRFPRLELAMKEHAPVDTRELDSAKIQRGEVFLDRTLRAIAKGERALDFEHGRAVRFDLASEIRAPAGEVGKTAAQLPSDATDQLPLVKR
jgi:hypothetical protein